MANYADDIRDFVRGDNLTIERSVTGIPAGTSVVRAWFTVKKSPALADAQALTQKIVTPAANADGALDDDGAASGTAILRFELLPADTEKYDAAYPYDVQLQLSTDALYTPIKGTIQGLPGVTAAAAIP